MSDFGADQPNYGIEPLGDRATPPPPPAAPTPPRRRAVATWVLVLCLVLVLGGGGFVAYKLVATGDSGPGYPDHWDSRILPYVKIAEKERGLTFRHPVAVRFLDPKTFEKGVRTDDADLSAKDRKQLEQLAGMLRALGLVTGDVDLFKAFNDAHGSGTLAYYSFETRSVTVRGTAITPSMKSTLVHELTHALQDQRFDVGKRTEQLAKKNDKSATTAYDVFDAMVEGDARRVETKYRDSLSTAEQKALEESQQQELDDARDGLKNVPEVVLAMMDAPYTLGESMLSAADQKGGNATIDDLFVDPPSSDQALLDPFTSLGGDTAAPVEVTTPKAPSGGKKFQSGEFGAVSLYLVLAERLPLDDALAAVLGRGGDAFVAYDEGGTSCVSLDVEGTTASSTATLYDALRRWNAYDPHRGTTVTSDGTLVHLTSCDPGTTAKPGRKVSQDAVELAAVRVYLGSGLMKAGAPVKAADCVSAKLVQEYSAAQLVDPNFGANDPKVVDRVRQISASCL